MTAHKSLVAFILCDTQPPRRHVAPLTDIGAMAGVSEWGTQATAALLAGSAN